MKLKEIKPGMKIHCNSLEEYNLLEEEVKRLGYGKLPIRGVALSGKIGEHVFPIPEDKEYEILWEYYHDDRSYTEFSDLIIPEMSAEEAFSIYKDICKHYFSCEECPLSNPAYTNCGMFIRDNSEKAIDIMGKWKSDHEKKEPEIEWVYRVFGAENNGEKFFQTEEEAIKRCEELAKSQKSKQYARYERVCRVKAAE